MSIMLQGGPADVKYRVVIIAIISEGGYYVTFRLIFAYGINVLFRAIRPDRMD